MHSGVASDGKPRSRQSSTSTTPSVSPGPSPRNSISHLAKPTSTSSTSQNPGSVTANSRSPMGSQSQLAKPKSSVPRAAGNSGTALTNGPSSAAAPAQSQAVRRTKTAGDRQVGSTRVTLIFQSENIFYPFSLFFFNFRCIMSLMNFCCGFFFFLNTCQSCVQ